MGQTIEGKMYTAPIDNSCYGAMENIDNYMNGERQYDVLRLILNEKQEVNQIMNTQLTSKDASILVKANGKEGCEVKMILGGYVFPVKSMMIDAKRNFPTVPTACMHLTLLIGKKHLYRHMVYLEHNCELFEYDIRHATGTKVTFLK